MKSLLKYVGGKAHLLETLLEVIPNDIDVYFEPFVGGATVALNVMVNKRVKTFYLNDINASLIELYKVIQDTNQLPKLIEQLEIIKTQYETAELKPKTFRQKYELNNVSVEDAINLGKAYVYYFFRQEFNQLKGEAVSDVERIRQSALFIFLNKTGFRGMYRENSKGLFNIPFGNYKNPTIYSKEQLLEIHRLFNVNNVFFFNEDFETFSNRAKSVSGNLFFYLDPPYFKLDKNSFVSYSKDSFSIQKQEALVQLCKNFTTNDVKFIQSNAYCEWVVEQYKEYNQSKIKCRRRINSKNPKQTEDEILVVNY